jgi:hypothetical protein
MTNNRPTVLILASDPAFSREITANWPEDPAAHSAAQHPEFVVLDQRFSGDLEGKNYDLALADASDDSWTDKKIKVLKQSLIAAGRPAIIIHPDPARAFYNLHGSILELRREAGLWAVIAGLVGREILRRLQAESRASEAGRVCAAAQAEATLGRYMVEMRTNVNNALTTVLGNAELLALDPGLPAPVQAQADTIRNMALRLHEVFQRFSSIEKELHADARECGKKAAKAAAGNS